MPIKHVRWLNPIRGTLGQSLRRLFNRRCRSTAKRRRAAGGSSAGSVPLETLEARHLLAFDFVAAYVQANEPFYTLADGSQAQEVISESPQQIVLRFTPGIVIDPSAVAEGVEIKRSGGADDPFDEEGDQGRVPDITVTPGAVVVDDAPNQNQIIVRFQETLPDDRYRITLSSALGTDAAGIPTISGIQTVSAAPTNVGDAFRDGGSFSFDVRLSVGQQVVAVVPQPVSRGRDNALTQARKKIVIYFDDYESLDKNSVQTAAHYKLIEVNSDGTEGSELNPRSVVYDASANKAELTFSEDLVEDRTFRLEIGGDGVLSPLDPVAGAADITSFTTSQDLRQLSSAGVVISGVITPRLVVTTPVGTLAIPTQPGSVDESGHRDNPIEAHGLPRATAGPAAELADVRYNFRSNYGVDPQGNQLFNQITETQKQRAREIFELYSRYLGVQFIETADQGITVVTGDMRAIDPLINTAPAGLAGGGMVIMDSTDSWGESEYGGSWFRVAMHEIGHALGLTHSYDLPSIMGGGLTGEPVFPGDYDLVHGSQLYPQTGSDIDIYKFTLPASGDFTAETLASRPGQPILSTLDSVLTLYREDPATGERVMIARNDDSFGRDSRVEITLDKANSAGNDYTYYVAVTSRGNTDFNPEIEERGAGGQTDGAYRLTLTHVPESTAATTIVDASGTTLDGDRDGNPGGSFNFWFRTAAPNKTIFVDKVAGVPTTVTASADAEDSVQVNDASKVVVGMGVVGSGVADGVTVSAIEHLETRSGTPVITGVATVAADETLTVEVNDVTYTAGHGNLTHDGSRWALTIPSGNSLTDGTYTVVVQVTDAAGNASLSSGDIVVDGDLPVDPTVDSQVTNSTAPIITGTATVDTGVGDTLTVMVNRTTYTLGTDIELSHDGDANTWALDLSALTLAEGTYPVAATATNGNGSTTGSANLVIDTTAPATPTVNPLTTSSSTPTITGTATVAAGETLMVEVNSETYTAGDGNLTLVGTVWTLVVPGDKDLADATYTVTATVTDEAGNTAVGTGSLEVDRTLLVDPTVTALVTNSTGPIITGTATVDTAAGETLTVELNSSTYTLGTDTELSHDGDANTWALDLSALTLAEGTYPVSATATNGNGSTTGSANLVIDTTAPATPTVNPLTTSSSTPIVTGTATVAAGETLTVEVNSETYTAGDGNLTLVGTVWTLVVPGDKDLADATYTATATVTDEAGNTASATANLEVDSALPVVPTVNDLITNETGPILTGTATFNANADESLEVFVAGTTYRLVADAELSAPELTYDSDQKIWTLDLSAETFSEGTYQVSATVTNAGGVASSAADLVVDLTAPVIPNFDPAIRVRLSRGGNPYSVSLAKGDQLRFFSQPDGSIAKPYLNVDDALAAVVPGQTEIIRILGNNQLAPNDASENLSHYQIGVDAVGNSLPDGRTFNVPAGVTVMIDAGAVFRMRKAIVDVGSSSPLSGDSRGEASLQILGVPGNQVKFSSLTNVAAPVGVYGPNLYQARGEWGGIVFRGDSDWHGSPAAGVRRPFLNTVQQSLISWGGGQVVVDSNRESFAAIQVEGTRPSLAFNEITVSAGSAIAATPDSFEEGDGRRGLDLRGNRFTDSSINGVFIKIDTPLGGSIEPLDVAARLTSTEVVYVLQENLIIAGGAGGFVEQGLNQFARPSGRLQIDAGVVLKLEDARIELGRGQSQLIAEGEGLNRVVFTSLADTRFGAGGTFDTNGNRPDDAAAGDWAGIFLNAGAAASIDQSYLAYAGGQSSIEGTISTFNPIEVHQGDLRLANSRLEFNADGNAGDNRDNRGTNRPATIFVRGAQPVIVGNDFRANAGSVISINTNSLNDMLQGDPGRQAGGLGRVSDYDDNFGPLVRDNRITTTAGVDATVTTTVNDSNVIAVTSTVGLSRDLAVSGAGIPDGVKIKNVLSATEVELDASVTIANRSKLWFYDETDTTSAIAALEVRPEEVTVEGVWDDTDIVHYVDGEIIVNNFHTATGLRLLSETAASLVVKFGPNSGITASGTPLEIDDRIGGTVQVVGRPGYPVVMTSIADDTVGASLDANGFPVNDTNVDGPETLPSAGDWRGLQFLPLSNDRNLSFYKESEPARTAGADLNQITENAEFLGVLAPNFAVENQAGVLNSWESAQEKSGDDNRRLGFEVHGFIANDNPGDVDLYRIEGYAGSEAWIDIDKTSPSLDTMVELLDASGTVLARSIDSLGDVTVVPPESPEIVTETTSGGNGRSYSLTGANILPGTLAGVIYAADTAQATFTVDRSGAFTFTPIGTSPNFSIDPATARLDRDAGNVNLTFNGTGTLPLTRIEVSYEHSRLPLATLGFTAAGLHGGYSLEKDGYRGNDSYSTNPRDAGMRVVLPGNRGTLSSYFIRVRSQPRPAGSTPTDFEDAVNSAETSIDSGATSGRYELRVRLRQQDEKPGSTVRYAEISYPQVGIDVLGLPNNSPLVGTTGEASGDNNSQGSAQELGNLLTSDRNTINVAGGVSAEDDVDWYTFTVDYDMIQSIGGVNNATKTWATVFDIDYADGFRGDLTLSVFDAQGSLIYVGRDSDVADDQPDPAQLDNDVDDLSRGSVGKLDPFIGSVQLPAGGPGSTTRYYVAVSSNERLPEALNAYFQASPLNSQIRLEPINSLERVVEDRIGQLGYQAWSPTVEGVDNTQVTRPASGAIIDVTDAQTLSAHVRPFTLADVTLFVSTGSSLFTVDAYRGGTWETRIADGSYTGGAVGDIDMRPDGKLFQYFGANGDAGNNGLLREIDTATGAVLSTVGDGISNDPDTPTDWQVTGQAVDALAIDRTYDVGDYVDGVVYSIRDGGESYLYTTFGQGVVDFDQTAPNTTRTQLTGVDAGRTGIVTGLQFANDTETLYGITSTGQFFRPFSGGVDADFSSVLSVGETFQGLAAGPVNLEGGRYQGTFFAITSQGRLVNIDPNGLGPNQAALVSNVFDTNADGYADSHMSNPTISGATGLAFSPLDVNLWHPTNRRGDGVNDPVGTPDDGHGVNSAAGLDNTRTGYNGGASMYFGLEDHDTRVGGYLSYAGVPGQFGTVSAPYNWQQELTTSSDIGNNYNLPGGAHGSLITNPFSLAGYSNTDKPTLYFNYFLDTQNAESVTDGMRDSARVLLSTDDGLTWELLATNNQARSDNDGAGPEAELPHTLSVSSSVGSMDNQHVQELFDTAGWRQARVDLGKWAGESSIRLRFDFSTAGEFDASDRSTTAPDAISRVTDTGATVGDNTIELESVEGLQVGMLVRSPADQIAVDDLGFPVAQQIPPNTRIGSISATSEIEIVDANGVPVPVGAAGLNSQELQFFFPTADRLNQIAGNAGTTGNYSGNDASRERGADNDHEGFYVDDIIVGFAERGEMVTGAVNSQTTFFDLGTPSGTDEYDAQVLQGPYQLEIRRGTEYAAQPSENFVQTGIERLFNTNDRLVRSPASPPIVLAENPLGTIATPITTRGDGTVAATAGGLAMAEGVNAVFWSVDLGGQSDAVLEFEYQTGESEQLTALPATFTLAGGLVGGSGNQLPTGDGVAISIDGGDTWTTLAGLTATDGNPRTLLIDLTQQNGLTLTDDTVIGFFQTGTRSLANDGGVTVQNGRITTRPPVETSGLVGDSNSGFELQQGQFLIEANSVTNAASYGIRIDADRRGDGTNAPHLGVPRNLATLNNARLVPGVVVSNNVVAGSGTAGIYFAGTPDVAGQPASAIPYGRIINNTIYGRPAGTVPQGNGIEVRENASPTLVNNVFSQVATAVNVDDTSRAAGTILAYSAFHNVGVETNQGMVSQNGVGLGSRAFVDASQGNFYPYADIGDPTDPTDDIDNAMIDSSINALQDRSAFTVVTSAIGIPNSPVLAPRTDLYGLIRDDDPDFGNAGGVGANVFKDRGAIERLDRDSPSVVLVVPADDSSRDQDSAVDSVVLLNDDAVLQQMVLQLNDVGIGVDKPLVETSDFLVEYSRTGPDWDGDTPAFEDYLFQYNENTNQVILASFALFEAGWYRITVNPDNAAEALADGAGNLLPRREFTVQLIQKPTSPEPPTADVGDAEATLRWNAPEVSSGGEVSGYRFQYRQGGSGDFVDYFKNGSPLIHQNTPTTTTEEGVLDGLDNNIEYEFRVAAINAAGLGEWSTASDVVVPRRAADAPESMDADVFSLRDVLVEWTVPAVDGANELTDYRIRLSEYDSSNDQTATTSSFDLSSAAQFAMLAATNDTTPLVSGTGVAGKTIDIYLVEGSTQTSFSVRELLETTTVTAAGTWEVEIATELAEGSNDLLAVYSGEVGPQLGSLVTLEIDTTPPGSPTFAAGLSPTNDDTPLLSGSGEAGATVTVLADLASDANGVDGTPETVIGTATVDAGGGWQVSSTVALPEGTITLAATQTDAAGNQGTAAAATTIVVDRTASAAPTIDAASPESLGDTTPEITGTGVAGETVRLRADASADGSFGTNLGESEVQSDGTWSITPSAPLPEGETRISATQTDPAGNTSPAVEATVKIDELPPAAPIFTSTAVTNDTTPTITGTGEPGATVTLRADVDLDGSGSTETLIGTAVVAAAGDWTITVQSDDALAEGTIALSATQTDVGGVTSTPATASLEIDTTPPGMPEFAEGKFGLTNDHTPLLRGTGEPGAIVTVEADVDLDGSGSTEASIGSTLVAEDGSWELSPTVSLLEGTVALSATQVDSAGNKGPASLASSVEIDHTLPVGLSVSLTTTTLQRPPLSGKGEAGSLVIIRADLNADNEAEIIGSGTVAVDGNWSIVPTADFGLGVTAIVLTQTDPAGNTGGLVAGSVTRNVPPPPPPTINPVSAVKTDQPMITGTGESGATIALWADLNGGGTFADIDEQVVSHTDQITVQPDGTWSALVPLEFALPDGTVELQATQRLDGIESAAGSGNIEVDTEAPDAPTFTVASFGPTNDATPLLSGAGEAGARVTVLADVDLDGSGSTENMIGTALVDASGNWQLSSTVVLPEGTIALSATQTDPAGNASVADTADVVIDTTLSAAPVFDAGSLAPTNDTTPTITGTGVDGDRLVLLGDTDNDGVPETVLGEATVAGDGSWSVTPVAALPEGLLTLVAYQVDAAGNVSARAIAQIEVDTTTPAAPLIDSFPVSPIDQPTITGTGEPGATVTLLADADVDGSGSTEATIGTATVDADGIWSIVANQALADGVVALSATQSDPAGNVSGAGAGLINVQAVPPVAPAIIGPRVQGLLVTSTATPTITGTGTPGHTARLRADISGDGAADTTLGSAVVEADGTWSILSGFALPEGTAADGRSILISLTQFNAIGLESLPTTESLRVDTVAPVAPAFDALSLEPTNDSTPTITGTGERGATVTLRANAKNVGSALIALDGSWSITTTTLGAGSAALSALQTDVAGNVGPAVSHSIMIDLSSPAAPTIDGISPTSDTTPTLTGGGEPLATVTLRADTTGDGNFDTTLGTAAVTAAATWSLTAGTDLPVGTHDLQAFQTDRAGNQSGNRVGAVTIDSTAALQGPTIDPNIYVPSNEPQPTITGTADAGATVRVWIDLDGDGSYDNATELLGTQTLAAGKTAWSITDGTGVGAGITLTVENTYSIRATQQATGVPQSPATFGEITFDSIAPSAPVITSDLNTSTFPVLEGTGETGATVTLIVDTDGDNTPDTKAGSTTVRESSNLIIDSSLPTVPTVNAVVTNSIGPIITGTSTAGDALEVVVNGVTYELGVNGELTHNGENTWTLALSALTLGEAAYPVTATATNLNGSTSGSGDVVIDTTNPAVPTVEALTTSSSTPTITGTATVGVGEELTVTVGSTTYSVGDGNLTLDGSSWTLLIPVADAVGDGSYKVTATVTDLAGNTATARPVGRWSLTSATQLSTGLVKIGITQSDVAGNASVVAPYTLSVTSAAPAINAPGVTSDSTPTVTGTGEPGATVTLFADIDANGTFGASEGVGSKVVAADGTWAITASTLPEGRYDLRVSQEDPQGNIEISSVESIEVDLTAPDAPKVVSNKAFNTLTPSIKGNGSDDNRVSVSIDVDGDGTFETVVGDADVAGGDWTVDSTIVLPEGTFNLQATQIDEAGNASPVSGSNGQIVIDTTVAAPTIDFGQTGGETPKITGTGEPGATVTLEADGSSVGTDLVQPDGTWSLSIAPADALSEGTVALSATQTDPAGNTSAAGTGSIEVDTTAPVAPTFAVASFGPTNDTTPLLTGTGEPGARVTVLADVDLDGNGSTEATIGTALVDGAGNWQVSSAVELPEGIIALSAAQTDAAGNTGVAATGSVETNYATPPAPAFDAGPTFVTNELTPTVTGTGVVGNTLVLFGDLDNDTIFEVLLGATEVSAEGAWSITPVLTLPEGDVRLAARQINSFGNISEATEIIRIDRDAGDVTFNPESLAVTNDTTPTITGTGKPGSTVELFADVDADGNGADELVGTAVVAADGTWSIISSQAFSDGVISLQAIQTDAVGNVGAPVDSQIEIDTVPPALPTLAGNPAIFADQTPLIRGEGEPGATVELLVDLDGDGTPEQLIGSPAEVAANGTWAVQANQDQAFPEGLVAIAFRQIDPAGNPSADNTATIRTHYDLRAVVFGLDADKFYRFEVAAVTTVAESGEVLTGAFADPAPLVPVQPHDLAEPVAVSSATTSGGIQLTWTAPSLAETSQRPVLRYEIRYAEADPQNGGSWSSTIIDAGTATTHLFDKANFASNATIWAEVRAVTELGDGGWSSTVSSRMPAAPAGVLELAAVNPGNASIDLEWTYTPPVQDELAVTGYVLEWKLDADDWADSQQVLVSAVASSRTISGLVNGEAYDVRIAARNGNGDGAFAEANDITPRQAADAPAAVSATLGEDAVELAWESPLDNGGTEVAGYLIEQRVDGGDWERGPSHDSQVDGPRTKLVTSLEVGKEYEFRVSALTANGELQGQPAVASLPSSGGTVIQPVARPTAVTATVIEGGQGGRVNLSWNEVTSSTATITGYRIEAHRVGALDETGEAIWTVIDAADIEEQSSQFDRDVELINLVNGQEYLFRVTAIAGTAPRSFGTIAAAVIPRGDTAGPANPQTSVTASSITLTWDPPAGGYGPNFSDYEVEISLGSASGSKRTAGARWARFDGLDADTEYTLRVRALFADGASSDWSPPIKARTGPLGG